MHLFKVGSRFILSVALVFASLSFTQAAITNATNEKLTFSVSHDQMLIITDEKGAQIAQIPPATLNRIVTHSPYSFQISYGRDVHDELSVIVTPNPENPTPLDFVVAGHTVEMDRTSVVTLTFPTSTANPNNPNVANTVTINGGVLGGVIVDGHAAMTAPQVVSNLPANPAPIPTAPNTSTVVALNPSVVAPATAVVPLSPGTTNQQPDAPVQISSTLLSNNPATPGTQDAFNSLNSPLVAPTGPPMIPDVRTNPGAIIIPTAPPGTSPV